MPFFFEMLMFSILPDADYDASHAVDITPLMLFSAAIYALPMMLTPLRYVCFRFRHAKECRQLTLSSPFRHDAAADAAAMPSPALTLISSFMPLL